MAADAGTGSRWAIVLLVYFILEFLVIYGMIQSQGALGIDSGISATDSFGALASPYCSTPRCVDSSVGLGCSETDSSHENNLNCIFILDEPTCGKYQGCEWQENTTTSYLWGWFTTETPAHCDGAINASFLYPNQSSDDVVASCGFGTCLLYNDTGTVLENIFLSDTPYVKNNKIACDELRFTWYTNAPTTEGKVGVLDVVGVMFGFSTDLGIPQPGQFLISLIFTYVPLIALLFVVRMLFII